MKKVMVFTALLLTATTAAEAKCSLASLNGNWSFFAISATGGPGVSISGGSFSVGATPYTITSFGSNCRGTGTFGTGSSITPFIVTSENIKSSSGAVPNMLVISAIPGPTVLTQNLFRK